jgi:DNA polymerase I-like protein with 3'-5' exonuclease and polymerase domains
MSFGLFYEQSAAELRNKKAVKREVPLELMKEQGCYACPLASVDKRRKSPKMAPQGSTRPVVYVILPVPTTVDDVAGEVGRDSIYDSLRGALASCDVNKSEVRYGYSVRCAATFDGEMPSKGVGTPAITCCSKYLEADIADTQPRLVLGVGSAPLRWATGNPSASDQAWRGRTIPMQVGSHSFEYMQLQDAWIIADRQKEKRYDTEASLVFRRDVLSGVARLEEGRPVHVVLPTHASKGVSWVTGAGECDYDVLADFLERALLEKDVGVDIETSALRPYGDGALLATCAVSTGRETLAFPVDHPAGWPVNMRRGIRALLYDFLVMSHRKIAHNLAFELEWFSVYYGAQICRATEWGDSMAAAHTLDERFGALSLGACTLQRFGFDVKALSNVDPKRLMQYPLADVLPYNGLDAKWCALLLLDYEEELAHSPKLLSEYERKVALTPTLVRSQVRGLDVDLVFAEEQRSILTAELARARLLLSKAVEVVQFEAKEKRPFSPTSDADVVTLVRDVMHRHEGRREEGGYSCDEGVLESIPVEAGIAPRQILAVRGASKLLSTYIEPLLNKDPTEGTVLVYPDGKVHTVYNSMIAETGRLSSEDPNNQNWPKRKRKEIRGAIVVPDGSLMLACDYGQIEARVVAMCSDDHNLVDALWTDFDIHGHWATRFVEVYPAIKDWVVQTFEVDWDAKGPKTLRQEAKNKWVFPQFFGSSWKSCARNLHLPDDVAQDLMREFWDQFPGVKRWQERIVDRYRRDLYVETLTGRRRRGALSLNQIINTPVQGTAADIVTDAMTRLSVMSEVEAKPQYQPPLNVHDDLTFEIPKASVVEDTERIAYEMCNSRFDFINVPLLVEASVSRKRWNELEEVAVYRSDVFGIHRR